MYLFFSFFYIYLMYTSLMTIWHTLYLSFDIYIYMLMYVIHLSFYVLFLFSLYAHDSYYLYAIFYFCFTVRCCDEFCLKCFRNTSCQCLSCHELSSCKVFQEFVIGLDFIVFNKWVWVEWFMTSLIWSFVCCGFVTNCQRGRLLGHMWIMLEHMSM